MPHDPADLAAITASLQATLPAWNLPPGTPLRLLSVSENATFLARAPGRALVLRVHRPAYHDEAALRSELAWIDAVRAAAAADTPEPIRAADGRRLVPLPGTDRTAAAFAFAPGTEPAPSPALFARLGRLAARLHGHARTWSPPPFFRRQRWSFARIAGPAAQWGDWRAAPFPSQSARATTARAAARLETLLARFGDAPDRFGLVHGDMRAANLLLHEDRLTLIDFDDCGFHWFAADFAAAASFLEHDPAVPEWAEAWLDAYRRTAPFPAAHAAMLPAFTLLRRIQLTAWSASHAETETARALGPAFAEGTAALADAFLTRHAQGLA